jgi:hypothetical protein
MLSKKIKFNPVCELSELTVPPPKPAKEYFPEWLKKMSAFHTKKPKFNEQTGKPNPTVRMCVPFTDTFSMGYIQETWTDIYIETENNTQKFYFSAGPEIITVRGKLQQMQHSVEYNENHFLWHPPWAPELPPGYSCIVTHPFNRPELPFHTLTGIIDSDTFNIFQPQSNFPFLLNKNFSGMIKKGTPMYQIIPFKRDEWKSEIKNYNEKNQMLVGQKIFQYMFGGYKKLHWKKKVFK